MLRFSRLRLVGSLSSLARRWKSSNVAPIKKSDMPFGVDLTPLEWARRFVEQGHENPPPPIEEYASQMEFLYQLFQSYPPEVLERHRAASKIIPPESLAIMKRIPPAKGLTF